MPEPAIVALTGIGAWVVLLLATVKALTAARRREAQARHLADRSEQLRLLNRFSLLMARENGRRGIIEQALQFTVTELGAGQAIFWQINPDGEPETPWLTAPAEQAPHDLPPLPDVQRLILARTAARGSSPLAVLRDSPDQRPQPLSAAARPSGRFVLYLPLRGGTPLEGVLEVYSSGERWNSERWELVEALACQIGGALQRARQYDDLREQAEEDFVTGLFNHRFMQVYLHNLISAGAANRFTVLLLDIDNFKSINDTHGHAAGDRVLQAVADQLKLLTDHVGTVGRFGGDEFIVVLHEHSREEAAALGQAFQDWLRSHPVKLPGEQSMGIVVSWGLAAFPEDGRRREELLAVADARLYQCKRPRAANAEARAPQAGPDGTGTFGFLGDLISSVDRKDHYTRAHSENTAEYAVKLAQRIALSPSAQRTLRLAALLHDVGKIGIPDDILRKPGNLTPEEFAVIRHHVSIAEQLIVDVPHADEVRRIARHHHERFDGSGYPDGLEGDEIPLLARVLAVADAFSAMTLDRPHRAGLSRDEAYRELERVTGSQLDPRLVKAFVAIASDDIDGPEPVPAYLSAPGPQGNRTAAARARPASPAASSAHSR